MKRELKDFCLVVDNFLPKELCDTLINKFNEHETLHQKIDHDQRPSFTQINVTQNKEVFGTDLHNTIELYMIDAVKSYMKHVPETIFWIPGYNYEQVRIKKYQNNNHDQFKSHIDASSMDTAKRFLAFFWYLNDVEEGGETEFFNIGLKVKPVAGRLVMFPPLWLFPHAGHIPVSNEKYLLSSYLHFS